MSEPKTARKLSTDRDLERAYALFNHKFFGNGLAVLYVRFVKDMPAGKIGHTKAYRRLLNKRSADEYGVRICWSLRGSKAFWMGTLLHEMVHVEQRNRYDCSGRVFNRRMRELAAAGAFDGIW